jgi:hypothetical protein
MVLAALKRMMLAVAEAHAAERGRPCCVRRLRAFKCANDQIQAPSGFRRGIQWRQYDASMIRLAQRFLIDRIDSARREPGAVARAAR